MILPEEMVGIVPSNLGNLNDVLNCQWSSLQGIRFASEAPSGLGCTVICVALYINGSHLWIKGHFNHSKVCLKDHSLMAESCQSLQRCGPCTSKHCGEQKETMHVTLAGTAACKSAAGLSSTSRLTHVS